MFKLAALHGVFIYRVGFYSNLLSSIFPSLSLIQLGIERLHNKSLVLSRANLSAVAATQAVQRRNAHGKGHTFSTNSGFFSHAFRSSCSFGFVHQYGANSSMRANEGALVTLDAVIGNPLGNIQSYTAFFISGGAAGEGAVVNRHQIANSQLVAFQTVHWNHNLIYKIIASLNGSLSILSGCPVSRNRYLHNSVNTSIHSSVVHIHNCLALLAIGMLNSILHIFNCFLNRNNISQLEEGSLHYHVDACAKANFLTNLHSIDNVQINIVLSDILLHSCRQLLR